MTFQQLVTRISSRFVNLNPADVDQQIHLALAEIGRFAGVDRSYIFQFEDNNRRVTNTHEWCADGITPAMHTLRQVPVTTFPWIMPKYLAGEAVCFVDLDELPAEAAAERQEFKRERIRSMASVPLICAGNVLGFIGFDSVNESKQWDGETIGIIRIVGEIFANAIVRRRADQALVASEQRYRQLVELAQEGIWTIDAEGKTTFVNPSMAKMLGYATEDMLGRHLFDFMDAAAQDAARKKLAQRERGISEQHDFIFRHRDGSVVHTTIETAPMHDAAGNYIGAIAGVIDVTDRYRADAAARQGETDLRAIAENSRDGILVNAGGRHVFANSAMARMLGYATDELIGSAIDQIVHPDEIDRVRARFQRWLGGDHEPYQYETVFVTKSGDAVPVEISAAVTQWRGEPAGLITVRDVRERQRNAKRLVELNRLLATVAEINLALVRERTRERVLTETCRILVEFGQYAMSWIGLADWQSGAVKPVAMAGMAEAYLAGIRVRCDDTPEGRGPMGRAIRRDQLMLVRDTETDEHFRPWKEAARAAGFRSVAALPLHVRGGVVGAIGVYAVARDGFGDEEIDLLARLMDNVGHALQTIEDADERQRAEQALRESESFLLLSQQIGHVGSFDWDVASGKVVWSTEMYRIFGLSPANFDHSFTAAMELIHPADRSRVEARVKTMLERCESAEYEFRIARADGPPRHAWGRGEVVCDEQGNAVRVIGTVQDITDRRRAEESVRRSEAQMRTVFEASTATINILRLSDETILYVNPAWEEATGWRREEAVGHPAPALKLWPDIEARESLLARVRQGESLRNLEWQRRTRSGEIRDVLGSIQRIELEGAACALIFTQDITDRKRGETQMRKLSSAVEQAADAIIITDPRGVIEYVNPAFETVTGFRADEAIGRTPALVRSGRHDRHFYKHLWETILAGRVYRNVLVNRKKDGTLYYEEKTITPLKDSTGKVTHFISSGMDITERMQAQERLQFLAYHDVLTELPNRALLTDRLDNAVARAKRTSRRLAVLFLDLDRFKTINDTLGHNYGDGLLQALAQRLRRCVREGDTISRVSGDEFVILLEDVASNDDIVHVARKVLEAFVQPFDVFKRELFITTSVGISVFPGDGEDGATLLKHADTAMYRAKESGRNNYQFYSADMSAKAIQLLTLETGLRRALEREEFVLHYQPLVDMHGGKIIGVEALLRWQHRELGLLYPGDFIQLLEDTGLIVPVGEWVLQAACRQAQQWQGNGAGTVRLTVNLSARQFNAPDLVDKVQAALRASALAPGLLELEITESMLMGYRGATQETLIGLSGLGVRFAVDDFGTGYSSLSYLKRFAIHTLKIDRSFVRDIPADANDASIVTTIVAMAHNLKLGVVAEGVEREEQLAFLKACRCDAYQGFYFSRPVEPRQFEMLLAREAMAG